MERLGVARNLSERRSAVLRTANALLLSVYLWHIPMIVLSAAVLGAVALLWPTAAPVVLSQLAWMALTWVLVATVVPCIARLEVKLIPRGGDVRPVPTGVGFALLFIGLFLLWQNGAVVHPAASASTTAVMLMVGGIGVLRHSNAQEQPEVEPQPSQT
jgi:hypothetical protein